MSVYAVNIHIDYWWTDPWTAADRILQNLPSTCRHINIILMQFYSYNMAVTLNDIKRLQPLFSRFTNLECLEFSVDDNTRILQEEMLSLEDTVRDAFSDLDERGAIRISGMCY